jgi:hypothetical protein
MSSRAGTRRADVVAEQAQRVQGSGCIPSVSSREFAQQLALGYAAGWATVLGTACACALIPSARWLAHDALAINFHARIRPAPAPTLGTFSSLLLTNVQATAWPLVPVVLRAEQSRGLRRIVHGAVLISLGANVLPVGAALGVYRLTLTPYLPHLPLELYAITTGASSWLCVARGRPRNAHLVAGGISIGAAILVAAFLETWAVPHR